MRRILLSVLLIVSVVLSGVALAKVGVELPTTPGEQVTPADPPVMERMVPRMGRLERIPNLILDVSCFIDNARTPAALEVVRQNTQKIVKRDWSSDGIFNLTLVKGISYKITAYKAISDPGNDNLRWKSLKAVARIGDIEWQDRTVPNLSSSTAISLHLIKQSAMH